MTLQKQVVESYIDGFRRTDHDAILSCLTEDIAWVLHGYRTLEGKAAFAHEIEGGSAVGSPTLFIDRLVEEGKTVVAVGHGEMTLKEAGVVAFVFAEVFTFTGERNSLLSEIEALPKAHDGFVGPEPIDGS